MISAPRPCKRAVASPAALLLGFFCLVMAPAWSPAQEAPQQTFARASEAVQALIAANKANDTAALNQILGPAAATLISSGDETQDQTRSCPVRHPLRDASPLRACRAWQAHAGRRQERMAATDPAGEE